MASRGGAPVESLGDAASHGPSALADIHVMVYFTHALAVLSVSVKRRHSVFDAPNFGQNAQKRKTVRQVTQRIFQ